METHRNLEVIWLLRRLQPDFKTIADFRRDNRRAFRQVFRSFVALCRELDLYGRELLAIDGTRIKAVNNRERNFTRANLSLRLKKIDERLERYLKEMDEADAHDAGGSVASATDLSAKMESLRKRRATLQAHKEALEHSGESQLSLTDPDARAMEPRTRVAVGYNAQVAVDTKHNLIAEQQVHSKVSDLGLLAETATAARDNLEAGPMDVVADRGYFKIEDIEACEDAGVTPYVPKPRRSTAGFAGRFPKSAFRYDEATDTYVCPDGQRLSPTYVTKVRNLPLTRYVNFQACRACTIRERCTTSSYRAVVRYVNEAVVDRMARRLARRPDILNRRRECVEHPFGSIKQWMGQGAFLMRRLDNVRGEFSLTALAYNMRRAINLVGVPTLIEAACP